MTIKTLYFDESGYTGYNLLDEAQPIFAIVSTDIEPAMTERIRQESFPNYGAIIASIASRPVAAGRRAM